MKRSLFIILSLVVCAGLFAQVSPYGSARMGFFYEMQDEFWNGNGESRIVNTYDMQANSRFGVDFKKDEFKGKVEFGYNGGNPNVRFLWAEQQFDGFSILAGQEEDGFNKRSTQVGFGDNALKGYGWIDGGRVPQIKFKLDGGFYLALIKQNAINASGATGSIDALIPKINLGYDWKIDSDKQFYITAGFQMYSYNEDFGPHDGSVTSFAGALTWDQRADALRYRVHGFFGQNARNMGLSGNIKGAVWNAVDNETFDVTTIALFADMGYDISDTFNLGFGVGYQQDSGDDAIGDDALANLGFFVQGVFKMENLRLTPEVGYLMQDMNNDDPWTNIYFGCQLRYDFK